MLPDIVEPKPSEFSAASVYNTITALAIAILESYGYVLSAVVIPAQRGVTVTACLRGISIKIYSLEISFFLNIDYHIEAPKSHSHSVHHMKAVWEQILVVNNSFQY